MPIFSAQEIARRHANLKARMAVQGLDAVIATSYPAFYYLTGVPIHAFARHIAVIILVDGEAAIVESIIEVDHTLAHTTITDIRTYYDYQLGPTYTSPQPPLESLLTHVRAII